MIEQLLRDVDEKKRYNKKKEGNDGDVGGDGSFGVSVVVWHGVSMECQRPLTVLVIVNPNKETRYCKVVAPLLAVSEQLTLP